MQNARIVAAPGLTQGVGARTAPAHPDTRSESAERREAWARLVTLVLHGRGTSDAGASSAGAPERPRHDLGLPFC
jgi:hypothetical protein